MKRLVILAKHELFTGKHENELSKNYSLYSQETDERITFYSYKVTAHYGLISPEERDRFFNQKTRSRPSFAWNLGETQDFLFNLDDATRSATVYANLAVNPETDPVHLHTLTHARYQWVRWYWITILILRLRTGCRPYIVWGFRNVSSLRLPSLDSHEGILNSISKNCSRPLLSIPRQFPNNTTRSLSKEKKILELIILIF